jgi:hypothetical protein
MSRAQLNLLLAVASLVAAALAVVLVVSLARSIL